MSFSESFSGRSTLPLTSQRELVRIDVVGHVGQMIADEERVIRGDGAVVEDRKTGFRVAAAAASGRSSGASACISPAAARHCRTAASHYRTRAPDETPDPWPEPLYRRASTTLVYRASLLPPKLFPSSRSSPDSPVRKCRSGGLGVNAFVSVPRVCVATESENPGRAGRPGLLNRTKVRID